MSAARSTFRRSLFVFAIGVILIASGGAAYAFWSSSGSGLGSAATGTSAAFTVTSTAPTGSALVPGGEAQSVPFTVANPSEGTLNLTSVVVTVANADGSPWVAVAGCSAADYSVGTPVVAYGPLVGGSDVDGSVAVGMVDTGENQDACKGVAVPLYFVAA